MHDLHAWTISDGFDAVTVHVVLDGTAHGTDVAREVGERIHAAHKVDHVTVQPEAPPLSSQLHPPRSSFAPEGRDREAKPFLKWVGGKRQLLKQLRTSSRGASTGTSNRSWEAGRSFSIACPKKGMLSDVNPELVDCYVAVRDHVEELIEVLRDPSPRGEALLRGP